MISKMTQKNLIVYYSLTGNTQFIADSIKEAIDADVQVIKPIKDLNPNSGSRFLWGGMQATMKKKPELEPLKYDPSDYDMIIIGSPVWAWTISPPIRTFISNYDLNEKDIALWMCCAGDGSKAMNRFKEELKNANIKGKIIFQEPLNKNTDEEKSKAMKWAKSLTIE